MLVDIDNDRIRDIGSQNGLTYMLNRYNRQIIFPEIGRNGQKKLHDSRIAIVGCGALGSRIAEEMTRSGCGYIRIIDRDFLELSNLQRQVLFTEKDVVKELPKAVAAQKHLKEINLDIKIDSIVDDLNYSTVEKYLNGVDLILDGTDNLEVRMVINDYSQKNIIPYIYDACVSSYGCTFNIIPGETACIRCIYPELPPPGEVETCDTAGIISPLAGVITSIASAEAIKLLVGKKKDMRKELLFVDVWSNEFNKFKIDVNPDCICCQKKEFNFLTPKGGKKLTSLCGRNAIQLTPPGINSIINLQEVETKLEKAGKVKGGKFFLKFDIDGYTMTIFKNGRVIIQGTTDKNVASSLYSRYIGE